MKLFLRGFFLLLAISIMLVVTGVFYTYNIMNKTKLLTKDEVNIHDTFTYAQTGHILINVSINGSKKKYPFILDNAATTIIYSNLLDEITLDKVGYFPSRDSNKKYKLNRLYYIDSLEIGNGMKFSDIATRKFDISFIDCAEEAYGIIGSDLMEYFIWQIDFEKREYTVTSDISELNFSKDSFNLEVVKDSRVFKCLVNLNHSRNAKFTLDLGSASYIKYEAPSDSIDYLFPNKNFEIKGGSSYGLNGPNTAKSFKVFLDSLSISNKSFFKLDATVSNRCSNLIGLGFFKNFIATFDFKTKRIILDPKDNPDFFKKYFGISLTLKDSVLKVITVIENSIPDKMGLNVGDTVIEINGHKLNNDYDFCNSNYWDKDTLNLTIKKRNKDSTLQILKHNIFAQ